MPVFEYSFSGTGDPPTSGSNIVIDSVMESSAGNYTCTATSVDEFPENSVTRQFRLFVGGEY